MAGVPSRTDVRKRMADGLARAARAKGPLRHSSTRRRRRPDDPDDLTRRLADRRRSRHAPEGRRQHPAADRRALRGRRPAAVLLDHQPAVVASLGEDRQDPVEVEDACAELREQPAPDALAEPGDRAVAEPREDLRVDVLQVDVASPARRTSGGPPAGRRRRPCSARRPGRTGGRRPGSRTPAGRPRRASRRTSRRAGGTRSAPRRHASPRRPRSGARRSVASRRRSGAASAGSVARPPHASRSCDPVEGDAEDLAAARRSRRIRSRTSLERAVDRAVDGRLEPGVDLGEAKAARGEDALERVALREVDPELGSLVAGPGDVVEDDVRAVRRAGAPGGRRCSRGSARCRSWRGRAAHRRRAGAEAARPARRPRMAARRRSSVLLLRPALRASGRAARDGSPGSARPTSPSCRVPPSRGPGRPSRGRATDRPRRAPGARPARPPRAAWPPRCGSRTRRRSPGSPASRSSRPGSGSPSRRTGRRTPAGRP